MRWVAALALVVAVAAFSRIDVRPETLAADLRALYDSARGLYADARALVNAERSGIKAPGDGIAPGDGPKDRMRERTCRVLTLARRGGSKGLLRVRALERVELEPASERRVVPAS